MNAPTAGTQDNPEKKTFSPLNGELVSEVAYVESKPSNESSVTRPPHYSAGKIECIEALRSCLGHEGFIDYATGNCVKYLWRFRRKNGLEDLKKAQVYLSWLIEEWELK